MLFVVLGVESVVVVVRNYLVEYIDENEVVDDNINDLIVEDSMWRYFSVVIYFLIRDIVYGLSIEVLIESSYDDESFGVIDELCFGE